MPNSAKVRMISKFEATGCLDYGPRIGRTNVSANAARKVQERMGIVTGSSTYGEVSARAVALAFHALLFG